MAAANVPTGRRTLATLALEQGPWPALVLHSTGHKRWASFRHYVNIMADVVSKGAHRMCWSGVH